MGQAKKFRRLKAGAMVRWRGHERSCPIRAESIVSGELVDINLRDWHILDSDSRKTTAGVSIFMYINGCVFMLSHRDLKYIEVVPSSTLGKVLYG